MDSKQNLHMAVAAANHLGGVFAGTILHAGTMGDTCPWLSSSEKETARVSLCPSNHKDDALHRTHYKAFYEAIYTKLRDRFQDKHVTVAELKAWAQEELKSCPGDWNMGFSRNAQDALVAVVHKQARTITTREAHAMHTLLEFRGSSMALADTIVSILGLPMPQGKKCRHYDYWTLVIGDRAGDERPMRKAFDDALKQLVPAWPLMAIPWNVVRTDDNARANDFVRPSRYVAKAVVLQLLAERGPEGGFPSAEELARFVRCKVLPVMSALLTAQASLILKDETVSAAAEKFLAFFSKRLHIDETRLKRHENRQARLKAVQQASNKTTVSDDAILTAPPHSTPIITRGLPPHILLAKERELAARAKESAQVPSFTLPFLPSTSETARIVTSGLAPHILFAKERAARAIEHSKVTSSPIVVQK